MVQLEHYTSAVRMVIENYAYLDASRICGTNANEQYMKEVTGQCGRN
jgi:hypothetical protein